MEDHYSVLNISKTATTDEIKKAYKKLAIIWHPDKNPDNQDEATIRFRAIAEAYEVLSDPAQRQQYDRGGASDINFENTSDGFRRGSSFGRRGFSDKRAFDIFNAFFADFDDFHQQAFRSFGHHSAFGEDPFNRRNGNNARRNDGDGRARGGFSHSLFEDDFFGGGHDPFGGFGGGFGGGLGDGLHAHMQMLGGGGGGGFGGGGMMSSSSTSFSSSSGIGGAGRSVSTSTYIGPDGKKVTKKETTVIHRDGRRETTVEEFVNDVPVSNNRLGYDNNPRQTLQQSQLNGSSHNRAIDLTSQASSSSKSHSSSYGGSSRRK